MLEEERKEKEKDISEKTFVIKIETNIEEILEVTFSKQDDMLLNKINYRINDFLINVIADRGFELLNYINVYLNNHPCYLGVYDLKDYEMDYTKPIELDKELLSIKKTITESIFKELNDII